MELLLTRTMIWLIHLVPSRNTFFKVSLAWLSTENQKLFEFLYFKNFNIGYWIFFSLKVMLIYASAKNYSS